MRRLDSSAPAETLFLKTIRDENLIEKGQKVLVGLSGGADSVCLLDLFLSHAKELGITVAACHVNHLLRGADSDRDEKFAHDLCAERNVEFAACRVDVKAYAKKNRLSLETAARECRYRVFDEAAGETRSDRVATAHHQGDLSETLLYRIFKGTGISGLASIPVRRGIFIRPLLYISKKQIDDRIKKRKLSFVHDLSNDDLNFDRNYIRKKIVPVIEERFPGFAEKAAGLSRLAADEEKFWEEKTAGLDVYLQAQEDGWSLDKKIFKEVPLALVRRKVREVLRECAGNAVSRELIETVMGFGKTEKGNKTVFRGRGLRVLSSYNKLCFLKETKKFHKRPKHVKLKDKFGLAFGNYNLTFLRVGDYRMTADSDRMVFDPLGASFVTVRGRKNGDHFKIAGNMTKKVQDHLVDNKVPLVAREETIVIEGPSGKVIALFVPGRGFRASEEFYVRGSGKGPLYEVTAAPSERA